jgi:GT2 family glycosyltransferase
MTELSIIIVNWNCLAYTEQCLASIRETANGINVEVIVVDNNSADAPCRSLSEKFPWARLVLSRENVGFGLANNLGVLHSDGKHLLFLNPDTIVLEGALQRMLSALESVPRGGAIGCKLLNADGSLQTTCVQPFPTILNQLFALDWLQRKWPALPLWGQQALFSTQPNCVHEVDVVSGAAILVKRDVFEQIGGFRRDYFMYAEEADLCLAIHRAGFAVAHTSDAQIVHFGGQSTKTCEDSFATVTMQDSIYRFLRRNRGTPYAVLYRLALLLSAFFRLLVLACLFSLSTFLRRPFKQQRVAKAFRKWLNIAQWSLGWNSMVRGHGFTGPVVRNTG